jgi:hypothetical protein
MILKAADMRTHSTCLQLLLYRIYCILILMQFVQFVFSFLYTRDWYSGERELSAPRVALFSGMLFLIMLGIVMAGILHTPAQYNKLDEDVSERGSQ